MQQFTECSIQTFRLVWIKLQSSHNHEEPDDREDHFERAISQPAQEDHSLFHLRSQRCQVERVLKLRIIGFCKQVKSNAKHYKSHYYDQRHTKGKLEQLCRRVLG